MIKKFYLPFILFLCAFLAYIYYWVCDDAFISFRYALNLAQGHGLRYNILEKPPVEGYTNFLWVLISALVEFLHYSSEFVMPVISTIFALATIFLLDRCLSERVSSAAIIGALLSLVLFPTFIIWTTSGLATMPYAFGILCLFYLMVLKGAEKRSLCIIASVFLALIRFDGLCFMLLIWGMAFIFNKEKRKLWGIYIVAGTIYAVYFAIRAYYYHSLWPNTVYMKVSYDSPLYIPLIERGFKYAATYFLTMISTFLAWCGFIVMFKRKTEKRYEIALLYLALLFYPISVGGDYMPFFRFYLPLAVIQTIPIAYLFSALNKKIDFCCALFVVMFSFLALFDYKISVLGRRLDLNLFSKEFLSTIQFSFKKQKDTSEFGKLHLVDAVYRSRREKASRALKKVAHEGDSIILGAIGVVGYRTGLHVYDQFGLVNTELRNFKLDKLHQAGHDKKLPPEHFLSDKPTFGIPRQNCKKKKESDALFKDYTKLCVDVNGEKTLIFKRTSQLRDEDKAYIIR